VARQLRLRIVVLMWMLVVMMVVVVVVWVGGIRFQVVQTRLQDKVFRNLDYIMIILENRFFIDE